jgi:hypothetical protein
MIGIGRTRVKGILVNPENAREVIDNFNNKFGSSYNNVAFAPVRINIADFLSLISTDRYLALRFHFVVDDYSNFNLVLRLTNNPEFSNDYSDQDQFQLINQAYPELIQEAAQVDSLLGSCARLNTIWTELIDTLPQNTTCVAHSSDTMQALLEYAEYLTAMGEEIKYFQFELGLFEGTLPEPDILKFFNEKLQNRH